MMRWRLACRLMPSVVYVISCLDRCLIFSPMIVGGHTSEGRTFPREAEGGCRFVQGEDKGKGIFTGEDCTVGREVV